MIPCPTQVAFLEQRYECECGSGPGDSVDYDHHQVSLEMRLDQ